MSEPLTENEDWARRLEGAVLDERYRVDRLLGAGGMGAVFEGHQIRLRRPVAIKLLRPEYANREVYRERFLREARSASRIAHRNVVDIIDFGESPDGAFFVMEYLPGEDLSARLRRRGPLSWPVAREILVQIVRGLRAAHAHGIVHRDVKPANIFLVSPSIAEPEERVKVLDFGVAKVTDPASSAAEGLTSADKVMGTAMYMAPEQALGKPADARSDVYALGSVAYQMLAGHPPIPGLNALEILMRRLNEPPPSLREELAHISVELDAFVRRAMAREAAARFQSMQEMEAALLEIPVELGATAPTSELQIDDAPTSASARRMRAVATPEPDVLPAPGDARPSDSATAAGLSVAVREPEEGPRVAVRVRDEGARATESLGMSRYAAAGTGPGTEVVAKLAAPEERPRGRGVAVALVLGVVLAGAGAFAGYRWLGSGAAPKPDANVAAGLPSPPPKPEPEPANVAVPDTRAELPTPAPDPIPTDPAPTPNAGTTPKPPVDAPADPPVTETKDPVTPTTKKTKRVPKPPTVKSRASLLAALTKKLRGSCSAPPDTTAKASFNIEASGNTTAVRIKTSGGPALEACLRDVVKSAKFPPTDAAEATSLPVSW